VKIAGKNIIITGGASGIGLAFAERLLGLEACVWLLDRDTGALAEVAQQYAGTRHHVRYRSCDVSKEEQVIETVRDIDVESGGIEVLINNAAVLKDQSLVSKLRGNIKKHSLADWHETLQSNLTGAFLMAREVADLMIRGHRRGVIVNISSISRHGNAGQSAYAASKAGIDALTVTWSHELAIYGIRVVGIAPGFVETPMTARIPRLFLERIRDKSPLKRFGTLAEFGHTIQYVLENDYLHGKTLELDGGLRF
jgi:3-oxoacyl-[acyl-carrier protein] reductase